MTRVRERSAVRPAGRLRPGLPVLWRHLTEVQVGTDPRWAVALGDLSPSATRALQSLAPGADLRTVVAVLEREEVSAEEIDQLLTHLERAGLVVPVATGLPSVDGTAWSLVSDDADMVRERAARRVVLHGLGRLGAVIASTLVSAGVRLVELDDAETVGARDTGVGGLSARDVGSPRAGAVARLLHDLDPAVRTAAHGSRTVDLAILVESGAADPVRYRRLLADGVPHLSVVLREASVLVGPLVVPGRSACLGCADLHRCDVDEHWPRVGAQLAGRADLHGLEVESLLAAVAGALAAAQAVAHLDGRPTELDGAALEVRLPDLLPRRTALGAHPDCGCLSLTDPGHA